MNGNCSFYVGWQTQAIDPATSNLAGIISLKICESGTSLLSPMDYLIVPNSPMQTTLKLPAISFSKHNEADYLYTVFPQINSNGITLNVSLQNKYHLWSSAQFKGATIPKYTCNEENKANFSLQAKLPAIKAYPNPASHEFKLLIPAELQNEFVELTIINMIGMEVGSYDGLLSNVNNYLENKTRSLAVGQYLLKIIGSKDISQTIKASKY